MGLGIALTDCMGEILDRIDDTGNILDSFLPPNNEESSALLTKLDRYGDTYFNYLQIKPFLEEWDQLAQRAQTPEEIELLDGVRRLATRCQTDRGLLRFIGD